MPRSPGRAGRRVKRCLGNGQPCPNLVTTPRCPDCQRAWDANRWANGKAQRYDTAWRKHSRDARAQHLATHGPTCPGYQRPPHTVTAAQLVVDHDLGVMCTACNATKANTTDRNR